MFRNTPAVLLTLVLAVAGGSALAEPAPRVVTGFLHPESVLVVGARRFVSNVGKTFDPLGHDGDGFISELDADGRMVAPRAFPGEGGRLDAPKGMAAIGGRLYVADIDRIVGFDMATRAQVFEAPVPAGGPSFLNDLDAMDGALVVTDTARGTVYRVDVASGVFTPLAEGIPGANGVVWDGPRQRLVVVGLGAKFEGGDLFEIPAGGSPRKIEGGPHGILDGLAVLPDGRMVISDWRSIDPPAPGAVTLTDAAGRPAKRLDLGRLVVGPADFAVDLAGRRIWVPAMAEGAVVIAPFEP